MILRLATLEDSALLRAWRNEPMAVAMSGTGTMVTEEEHKHWLANALNSEDCHLFIAELEQPTRSIGMGRLNALTLDWALISYSVAKGYRGMGYGGLIISDLCLKAYELKYRHIQAKVHYQNTASLLALQRAGFAVVQPALLTLLKELP